MPRAPPDRPWQVSIGDLRVLLWVEHQMQDLAIVLDSCQSRCQSTSHNQTGLWRPSWIGHLTLAARTALRRTAWTLSTSLRIWRLGVRMPCGAPFGSTGVMARLGSVRVWGTVPVVASATAASWAAVWSA